MLDFKVYHTTMTEKESQDVITLRDVHKILWVCRDFELNHLWQRSIFLATFLTLWFTGYGVTFSFIIDYISSPDNHLIFVVLSIAALFISLLGVVFSMFWIMMSKGSKAWYEIYESAICQIEGVNECSDENSKSCDCKKEACNTKDSSDFCGRYTNDNANKLRVEHLLHGQLAEKHGPLSNSLFSSKGGGYSVSRVNIAIGQVSLIVWLVLYYAHVYALYISNYTITCCCGKDLTLPIIIGLCVLLPVVFLFMRFSSWLKSSILN